LNKILKRNFALVLQEFRKSKIVQLIFIISLTITLSIIYSVERSDIRNERISIQKVSSSYVGQIKNNLYHAFSATYPIAALIKARNGDVSGFSELATEMLPNYPGAASLQLQPDGILKYVVPLKGNEAAIGHNLLLNPARSKEAFLARDSGRLTLAGPFDLIQGGVGAAARLPIYLDGPKGKTFWGFSTVLIRFPDVFESVKLPTLTKAGIAYQLSRIHPDTGKLQIILSSAEKLVDNPEIFNIKVPNGIWTFKVSPIHGWGNSVEFLIYTMMGLLFVFLITFSALLVVRIKGSNKTLEMEVSERTELLKDNLKRLDIAINVVRQSWFDLNIVTGETIIDDSYPVMLGYDPKDFHSSFKLWLQRVHPDDLESVETLFQQALTNGTAINCEYRSRKKTGEWLWLKVTGEVIEKDTNGKPQRMIGMFIDISETKRTEEVLRLLAESNSTQEMDVFHLIVEQLAYALNTRYAFIAKVDINDLTISETIALWAEQEFIDNITYPLDGSPCQDVVRQGMCFYSKDVQQQFPKDSLLMEIEAESYLGVPLRSRNGNVIGLIVVIDDKEMASQPQSVSLLNSLAVRAAFELERIDSYEKLNLSARVFNDTREGIMVTNADKMIIDVNPALCTITGYSREEVIGHNPRILSSGKQGPQFYAEMWQSIDQHGHWQGEVWNRRKGGELYAEHLTISTLLDQDDNIVNYVGVFTDITEAKQQQEKLHLMAHYDVLTQLPNRSLFVDRFNQAIAHSNRSNTQLAVCFLDLDDFKPVNDNFGHEVGDQLLLEVAERIKAVIREEDTVSRQGGDEFTLILNDIEEFSHCEKTIQRIQQALSKPYIINDEHHNVTASIGITLYPEDNGDIDTLIRHADQAMYQAKQAGRNRYHLFNTTQDQEIVNKNHRLTEVEQALSNREFTLYYQPKINMVTGMVFGAEALIRWNHPEKGLIPPMDFLPLIDGSDLEIQIGDWVIHQALRQLYNWLQQGIKLEVSVNIASYHLQSKCFIDRLEELLALYPDVDSRCLQLEILESSALGDLQTISDIISTCQSTLGVKVALDDFGTGYSSLTHLRSLTANTIKIDQSFVRDMLDDPNDYTIIDGIIGLSDSFSRNVIAEGVETTNHGLMLMMMGCDEAQGYGISKPMPADELPAWLSDYMPNDEWLQFGKRRRSDKENKVKLFRLILEQWKVLFVSNVQSEPDAVKHWPVMNHNQDHCGQWIKRAKQEELFEQRCLDALQDAHDEVHFIAQAIQTSYVAGDITAARGVLDDLYLAFQNVSNRLGQCE